MVAQGHVSRARRASVSRVRRSSSDIPISFDGVFARERSWIIAHLGHLTTGAERRRRRVDAEAEALDVQAFSQFRYRRRAEVARHKSPPLPSTVGAQQGRVSDLDSDPSCLPSEELGHIEPPCNASERRRGVTHARSEAERTGDSLPLQEKNATLNVGKPTVDNGEGT